MRRCCDALVAPGWQTDQGPSVHQNLVIALQSEAEEYQLIGRRQKGVAMKRSPELEELVSRWFAAATSGDSSIVDELVSVD